MQPVESMKYLQSRQKKICLVCTTHILLYIFRSSTDIGNEATLTVVFHAILSDKFDLDEGTKIVIRGEEPVFDDWNKDGVTLKMER